MKKKLAGQRCPSILYSILYELERRKFSTLLLLQRETELLLDRCSSQCSLIGEMYACSLDRQESNCLFRTRRHEQALTRRKRGVYYCSISEDRRLATVKLNSLYISSSKPPTPIPGRRKIHRALVLEFNSFFSKS